MKNIKLCNGLSVGEKVNDFIGIDQNANEIRLYELLKNGKVVIVFYQGHWSPFCNLHLQNLQRVFPKIKLRGANVIAVTSGCEDNIQKTIQKTQITLPLIYDKNHEIMDAFDVAFIPDDQLLFMFNAFMGANLIPARSNCLEVLPVPATFVIAPNGKIIWRHFDKDYRKRSSPDDILRILLLMPKNKS